ncbi:MAG: class I SAM-dependent methyltransferase [Thermomicrobiales bacterium]|nr:class I SAM-dependent methyltransferase [Thermomicrobiales bacterium]
MRRFFTDRTPPDDLSRVYDRQAPTWLRGPGRVETWLAGEDMRNEWADSLRGDVLEIGVGAGDTLLRLSLQQHQVTSFTGIDLSPGMIVEAEKVSTDFPTRLLVANAEDLGHFPDDSFDTVAASLVFCTVSDVPRALAEIARVTKPEGQVVLLEHMLSTNRVVAKLQRWAAPIQIRTIGCHLDRTTDQTLRDCGYTIARARHRRLGVFRLMVAIPPSV